MRCLSRTADADGSFGEIVVNDISPSAMRTVLKHCYNGHDESMVEEENALELLAAAHVCQLAGLKDLCVQFLLFHLTRENAVRVLVEADRCCAHELKMQCVQYIVHHLKAVQNCPDFPTLPKHLVGAIKYRASQKIDELNLKLNRKGGKRLREETA